MTYDDRRRERAWGAIMAAMVLVMALGAHDCGMVNGRCAGARFPRIIGRQ